MISDLRDELNIRKLKLNKARGLIGRIINKKARLSTYHLDFIEREIGDSISSVKSWEKISKFKGFYIDEVSSIEKSNCDVFDFYIPEGHDFVSNGFISHNCQGLSLDSVEIDCEGIFADSQFYVAISRARSLEGLKLRNLKGKYIRANIEALDFYKNLQEN